MRALRTIRILLVGLLIGGASYLLLIDTASLPELYVLAGVALACGLAYEVSHEQRFATAWIAPWWLSAAWRVGLQIPRDIVLLSREALAQSVAPRRVRGVFRATRFEAVADTAEATGKRALSEWLGSAAPNTIVVGVDPERQVILVHQLSPRGRSREIDPLQLG